MSIEPRRILAGRQQFQSDRALAAKSYNLMALHEAKKLMKVANNQGCCCCCCWSEIKTTFPRLRLCFGSIGSLRGKPLPVSLWWCSVPDIPNFCNCPGVRWFCQWKMVNIAGCFWVWGRVKMTHPLQFFIRGRGKEEYWSWSHFSRGMLYCNFRMYFGECKGGWGS